MTRVVGAQRRKLARLQKGSDWREVLKPSLTPADQVPMAEQALEDCRYAYSLGPGSHNNYPALFNHFAMWLYPPPPPDHPEIDYAVALEVIRKNLFTSKCFIKGSNKHEKALGCQG